MKKLFSFLLIAVLVACSKDTVIYTLTATANPSEGGSVSPSSQQYDSGDIATITATPSFEYVFQDDLVNQNGDDAVELFKGSDVIETFGDINIDGTGTTWEYTDSWAYKDASGSAAFGSGNWIFGGINCTDGTATIFESSCLYPLCQ